MIAIASDHGGFEYKKLIEEHLVSCGIEYKDFGTFSADACDYPDYAKPLCESILADECESGILICGTGIGMSITANRYPGIRAAVCTEAFSARATREHNNANVLCLGARVISPEKCIELTDIFLQTPFSNDERHIRRIEKIEH
ncbi:MAG: ribose 5-phosphate isomerase B [Eubacteriales bacterium]|nr:ribose 5-phosphate isomerase B [Eubacteriales bacterium]